MNFMAAIYSSGPHAGQCSSVAFSASIDSSKSLLLLKRLFASTSSSVEFLSS